MKIRKKDNMKGVKMGKPNVACQLIIFGARGGNDLPGVLKEIADAGYAGIEAGPSPDASAMKKLLDSFGLKLAGIHTGYGGFDNLKESIAYLKAMNSNLYMISGVGDTSKGIKAYEDTAKVFNEVGRKCHEEGIKFCYHNHSWEFQKYDGVVALDRLYELTDPKYVHLCVDVYWVQHGGQSPVEFLKKNLDRVATVHLKDMFPDKGFAEVGSGIIDFPGIKEVLKAKKDLEWVVVEQDNTKRTPKESATMSRSYLKEKIGV
ncbi:MAG: sugar phosphate isomerase/epimerase [Candidatus Poribacteria bacterium]